MIRKPDWGVYRACPVCRCEPGKPCRSLSAMVVNGRPSGNATATDEPHRYRQYRSFGRRITPFTERLAAERARRQAQEGA